MSKYLIDINERSRKGKALKMLLENEEIVKITPFEQNLQEIQIPDSNFKSWDEFDQGFGIGRNNLANLKDIRAKAWFRR
jgi:hypothetical protein